MADPGFGAVETNTTFSNSINCKIPASASPGDRLVVVASVQGATELSSGPADCTMIEIAEPTNSIGRMWVWTAVVGDTGNLDPGDPLTVTMSGNSSMTMAVYVTGGPADVQDSVMGPTSTMGPSEPFGWTSPDASAMDDARALHIYGVCAHVSSEVPSWTVDAATTERVDIVMEGGSRFPTLCIADEAVSSGAVAGRTATATVRCQSAAATVVLATSVTRPVADAGSNQNVLPGATVNLSGSADDGGGAGGPYTYAWTQVSGTDVTLSDDTAQSPSFTAPVGSGPLVFSLTVTDSGDVSSMADTVTVTVVEAGTLIRPVADVTVANWQTQPSDASTVASVVGDNNDGTYAYWDGDGTIDTLEVALPEWLISEAGGRYGIRVGITDRSEEHTSELQSRGHLVCRLLLEKKNITPHLHNR